MYRFFTPLALRFGFTSWFALASKLRFGFSMMRITLFLLVWACSAAISCNGHAANRNSELSSIERFQLANILGEQVLQKDFRIYLSKGLNERLPFVDYEISRFERSRRFGVLNAIIGSLFIALSGTMIVAGAVMLADVDDCEERNLARDEGGWGEMCGLGTLFGAASFAGAAVAGTAGGLFMVHGIRKVRRADGVLKALFRYQSHSFSSLQFSGVSLLDTGLTKVISLTFSF